MVMTTIKYSIPENVTPFFHACRQDSGGSTEGDVGSGKFSVPPSPSSVEGATGEKAPAPAASRTGEALVEAPSSTVTVLASREGTLSDERGTVEPVVGAKSEGAGAQSAPCTPRTEEASPAGGAGLLSTTTPVHIPSVTAARGGVGGAPSTAVRRGGIGPFALPPESPMLLLSLTGLSTAGCIPDHKTALASGSLFPYESLDRSTSFIVFVSHRWVPVKESKGVKDGKIGGVQGGSVRVGEGGDRGERLPDMDSTKHGLLVEGLNSVLASLPREVTVFVWIDHSCIDQVGSLTKRLYFLWTTVKKNEIYVFNRNSFYPSICLSVSSHILRLFNRH